MSGDNRDRDLRDQAAAWFVRVSAEDASDADWQGLTDWLEASDDHRQAYEEIEAAAADVDLNAAAIGAAIAPQPTVLSPRRPSVRAPRLRFWIPAVAIAACVAGALLLGPIVFDAWRGKPELLTTGAGETRSVTLADGTVVRLDVKSRMTVRLSVRERRVSMGDAEATFDVAKDPKRPFVIDAGDQRIRVVGTEFNVRHYDRTLSVSVRRGVVEVSQPDLGATPVARLVRGQALDHREGSAVSKVSATDPDTAFAWTQGRLVSDGKPLPELIAYLNRRYPVPIRLSARASALRFYGVLVLDPDEAVTMRRLAGYLSLSVERSGSEFLLR